jgi:hypothetical protein
MRIPHPRGRAPRPGRPAGAATVTTLAALTALAAALTLNPGATDGARADEGAEKDAPKPGSGAALRHGVEVSGTVATAEGDARRVARFWFNAPEKSLLARIDVQGRADVDVFVSRKPIGDLEELIERTAASERRGRARGRGGDGGGDGEGEGDGGPRGGRGEGRGRDSDARLERRLAGDVLLDAADGEGGTERLLLLREDGLLAPGDHYVAVAYRRHEAPRSASGAEVASVEFKVKLTLVAARVDGKLEPGKPVSGTIDPDAGPFRTYTVDVPPSAKVLRLDLYDAPQDLNLRVRRGEPMLVDEDADADASRGIGTEELVLEPEEGEPLAGTWYVDVVDAQHLDFASPFKLRASFSKEPDASLTALPRAAAPKTPLERAVQGVVELLAPEGGGGSGVLISDRGFLLTNYHVVQDQAEGNGTIGEPMIVALTLDPRDTAKEAFRAKVVAVSPELDLALVRCETGLYGQPIPADYRFPTAPLGAAEKLGLGDPLFAIGYPAVGGTGSRVSITYTRGVVAGFERRGATLHLKTDAMINSGNSGGGVFNERHELVGFATETVGDDETQGQIGYARPIWLVPADWWAKAGVAPPKKAP